LGEGTGEACRLELENGGVVLNDKVGANGVCTLGVDANGDGDGAILTDSGGG